MAGLIPRSWRRLKLWGRVAVPFVAPWVDGKPQFGKKDAARLRRCGLQRICNVCGQRLGDVMVFAGGVIATQSRVFHEPPLHEECIRASFDVCPYLSGLLGGKIPEGGMYLTFARSCDFRDRGAQSAFVARSVVRVETVYPDPEAARLGGIF